MKRSWVPVVLCLSLLSLPAALRAEPAPPGQPTAAPAVGCDQQPASLTALTAAPVCQPAVAEGAAVPDPLAGAVFQTFVCCTAADRADCKAECGTCSPFPHCFAFECICDCVC